MSIEMPSNKEEAEKMEEIMDRVDELRYKKYTDEEIMDSMSVDEGYEKERIEKAMKKLDEEKEKKEAEGGDANIGELDSREEE
ncbi:hypothetical protein HY250_03225 [Candidatus Azambacteria bacterium]|nr:hypothetical protein [Candidatus Azambacteria bacterium]